MDDIKVAAVFDDGTVVDKKPDLFQVDRFKFKVGNERNTGTIDQFKNQLLVVCQFDTLIQVGQVDSGRQIDANSLFGDWRD